MIDVSKYTSSAMARVYPEAAAAIAVTQRRRADREPVPTFLRAREKGAELDLACPFRQAADCPARETEDSNMPCAGP